MKSDSKGDVTPKKQKVGFRYLSRIAVLHSSMGDDVILVCEPRSQNKLNMVNYSRTAFPTELNILLTSEL